MSVLKSICRAVVCVGIVAAPPAFALAQRTFVSAFGNDANPCSGALPCRGFAAAIAQTIAGGEVIVKDSAGYGTVLIAKSISIIAPAGVYAGITVTTGNGMTINAPGIKVLLQGLTINGLGGTYGILLQDGAELTIHRCTVSNMTSGGVYVTASGSALAMSDSVVRGTTTGPGVWLHSNVRAVLERVRIVRNLSATGHGILADSSSTVSVASSVVSANDADGVRVAPGAGVRASANIDDSVVSQNGGDGVSVVAAATAGTTAVTNVVRTTLSRNAAGIQASTSGSGVATVSASRNLISHNSSPGFVASGTGATIAADENTFSRNAGSALAASSGGSIHTVRGADLLPSNAGEQTTPTSGSVVPVSPF